MVARVVALVAVAGCGRIGFDSAMSVDASAWNRHSEIDVINPTGEELRDVPILVRLDPTRIDYSLAAPDGRDLRFTDARGELALEIERWDPNGVSIVWVRVPTLAANPMSTPIVMHYGNAAASALPADAAWSADHVAVYHFADGVNDATSTHLDASLADGAFTVYDHLGQALALSPNNGAQYAVIANVGALDEVVTFSGWMRSESTALPDFYEGMITWPVQGSSEDSPYLGLRMDRLFFETLDQNTTNNMERTLDLLPNSTWAHLALVWRATTVETYVDGVPGPILPVPSGPLRPAVAMFLGADCDNCASGATVANEDFLDGAIDEIRLERVPRSAAWFEVQYASMRDTLIAW